MAARIEDGQTVPLDSGSTTLEVAKRLTARGLTIVTNDLRIGLEVANRQPGHLVVRRGELLPACIRCMARRRCVIWPTSASRSPCSCRLGDGRRGLQLQRPRGRAQSKMREISSRSFSSPTPQVLPRVPQQGVRPGITSTSSRPTPGSARKVAGWFTIPVERQPRRGPGGHRPAPLSHTASAPRRRRHPPRGRAVYPAGRTIQAPARLPLACTL
ncbi:MAG: hypothetical protein IPF40_02695 [Actinomycetales bacterium]|uniref:DeoR-like transcriptional repressor C-terminal sensor domain-containing protein n=1 Tax=Candidatus Phosphoribacter hodrii TaxID=2953743 RepID=A0A934X466_9MICO|nr:hypothetical protein [Candidatus Phosphoribacter hodrii]